MGEDCRPKTSYPARTPDPSLEQAPAGHVLDDVLEREAVFRAFFEHARIGIALLDRQYRMAKSNPAMQAILGYTEDELRGIPLPKMTHGDDKALDEDNYMELVQGRCDHYDVEKRYLRKDGSVIWGRATVSVVRDDAGQMLFGMVFLEDITEQKRTEETLRALLIVDELTGLYNRRGFLTLARQELKVANRNNREMLLLYADLDDLKAVNDTYGHQEGDRALIMVAEALQESFRGSDIVARVGGDEFVVLALEATGNTSEVLVRRLEENLRRANERNERPYRITMSIGVARYNPVNPSSIEDLLDQADKLMYQKKRGKQ